MNDKFIVKFEAGPMEQSFKFGQTEIGSLDVLKAKLNIDFINKVHQRFNEMYLDMVEIKKD